MSPYYADRPATTILFVVTIGAWVLLELRQGRRHRAGATGRDRGSYFVLVLCIAVGWVTTAVAVNHGWLPTGGEPTPFVVGLVVAWSGIALRAWAFHTLGDYFTFRVQTSADQPVIDSGPYRFVRHPGYTGIALVLVGLGLGYGTWLGVIAMVVVPTIGLVNRIRVEECALDAELGAVYRTYAHGRKRLVPYLW